jgi:hypothetical protein
MLLRPAPITDSPLFWLLLFGSVGLVMLTAVEPKFAKRQERIERMQQSREFARQPRDQTADAGQSFEQSATQVWQPVRQATLRPLMVFLAGMLMAGMVIMHLRRRKAIAECRPNDAAELEGESS